MDTPSNTKLTENTATCGHTQYARITSLSVDPMSALIDELPHCEARVQKVAEAIAARLRTPGSIYKYILSSASTNDDKGTND